MDIARPVTKKFSPHPVVKPEPKDIPAQVHPAVERAIAKTSVKKQAGLKAAQPKTSKQVKDEAIERALATPKTPPAAKTKRKTKNPESAKWRKRLIITACAILVLLGALYAVYRFIPAVSVGIAATRAGVDAQYPGYVPDGFALSQPVNYSEGEVKLKFASNSNETAYTISQKRSTWDSSAVLDNIVEPLVGENYTTTQERGLKIFTYARGAAWVNGGILYTLSGDATLSNDQIRRIATSL